MPLVSVGHPQPPEEAQSVALMRALTVALEFSSQRLSEGSEFLRGASIAPQARQALAAAARAQSLMSYVLSARVLETLRSCTEFEAGCPEIF